MKLEFAWHTHHEERERIRQAVNALEICWRCQRVSASRNYLLGGMVHVWLCANCSIEARETADELEVRESG